MDSLCLENMIVRPLAMQVRRLINRTDGSYNTIRDYQNRYAAVCMLKHKRQKQCSNKKRKNRREVSEDRDKKLNSKHKLTWDKLSRDSLSFQSNLDDEEIRLPLIDINSPSCDTSHIIPSAVLENNSIEYDTSENKFRDEETLLGSFFSYIRSFF